MSQSEPKKTNFGIVSICVVLLCCYVGLAAFNKIPLPPETYIYTSTQVPKRYIKELISLGLLEKDEKIQFFYSNAMFDIKEGMYFVTDRKLVAYSKEWENPEAIVGFDTIIEITPNYDEDIFSDSMIDVETEEWELEIPLSNEMGRDKDFVEYLREMSGIPEKRIYIGEKVPKKYIEKAKSLELLSEDEKIKFFYAERISKEKTRIYFATDKHLVLYNSDWEEPETIIPFATIIKIVPSYNPGSDTDVYIETEEFEVEFSLLKGMKRDREFIYYLKEKADIK